MNAISRRHFLARSAAVSAVGLPLTAGAVVEAASTPLIPGAAENPELLRLCDEFDAELAGYRQMVEFKNEALKRCAAMTPPVPDELVVDQFGMGRWLAEWEDDAEYKPIRQADGRHRMIISSHQLERDRRTHGFQHRDLRKKLKIAQRHEAAVEKAKQDSGLAVLLDEVNARWTIVRRLAEDVGATKAETSLGIMRKATVAHGLASIDADNRARAAYLFGQDFWAEMVAVLGREGA